MNERTTPEQGQAHLIADGGQPHPKRWLSDRLKTGLIVILACILSAMVAYHAGKTANASAVTGVRPINDKEAQRRLIALEEEVRLLKADLLPQQEPHPVFDGFSAVFKFVEDHLALLSVVGGLAFALFVYFYYDINYYFDNYIEINDKRKLSKFNRELGDRLMILNEWESAEAAYRGALEINPTDIAASLGIAMARVFQPLNGQSYAPPYLIDVRLDALIENILNKKSRNKNNLIRNNPDRDAQLVFLHAQLVYLKGINRRNQGDEKGGQKLLEEATEIDPKYVGSYIELGYSLMCSNEFEKARSYFQKAFNLDKSYPLANANLGICHLLTLQFDEARTYFDLACRGDSNLFYLIGLGDAQLFCSNFKEALSLHSNAVRILNQKGIEKERYTRGVWLRNFMPLKHGDTETVRLSVNAYTFEQKKTIALYALALDQAINGEIPAADKTFADACALDKEGEYQSFVGNQIKSILNLLKIPQPGQTWLAAKLRPPSARATLA
jgi:tetratricopeptide (TPR) repeat protein